LTTNKHDVSFPIGTSEWFGTYIIRYETNEKMVVEAGHVVMLPKGKIQLFDAKRDPVVPIFGCSFSIIIGRSLNEVFCSFVPVVDEKVPIQKRIRAG